MGKRKRHQKRMKAPQKKTANIWIWGSIIASVFGMFGLTIFPEIEKTTSAIIFIIALIFTGFITGVLTAAVDRLPPRTDAYYHYRNESATLDSSDSVGGSCGGIGGACH